MNGLIALFLALAMIAGAVVPAQAGANAALGRSLGHPLWATVMSLGVSAVLAAAVMLLMRVPLPDFAAAGRGPGWTWLGGAAGVFYITAALMLAPRMGSGAFMAAVIGGQVLAALAIDRYGLLGFAARAITPAHWAGAALVVAGVVVTQLANHMANTMARTA